MKGVYTMSDVKMDNTHKTLVYPVPLKGAYFLGVHTTLTVDGYLKIGPTIFPAFSIENYNYTENLKISQFLGIAKNYARLLLSDQRKLIWTFITEEMPKLSINRLVRDVSKIHHIGPDEAKHFTKFYRPGIRAQLLDKKSMKMVNDFLVKKSENEMHLLNIVSPGFTCAMPVADYIVD